MTGLYKWLHFFFVPAFVVTSLILAVFLQLYLHKLFISEVILIVAIVVGSWQLVRDTWESLVKKSFALDYIALLAILTGVIMHNYWVAAVIVLMMAGGNTLEDYAQERAKRSLKALANRIPHEVQLLLKSGEQRAVPIETVEKGSQIIVRKGEVVPLDGMLVNENGLFDESSLTGEPYPVEKITEDVVRSGTVNVGQVATLITTVTDKNSTYRKIVALVEEAQSGKAPFIQLADQLSGWFTIATLIIAAAAYLFSHDPQRILAVLVIATPCPLILATPIALIGGINSAARERIIFKKLSSLEVVSKVTAVIFDKTGTITFGLPRLENIEVLEKGVTEKKVLELAAGLERNSLHPLAKAVLEYAKQKKVSALKLHQVHEEIGSGLSGLYEKEQYSLKKDPTEVSAHVLLFRGKKAIARFSFIDEIKPSSTKSLELLENMGLSLAIFTGDTLERARKILEKLPHDIAITADCSPEDKRNGIAKLKRSGEVTAMVGDGINDAPALALADVGIAFSHEEHTAASEAADVILLGGNFASVIRTFQISHRTLKIAKESMYIGVGLSIAGMLWAAAGHLPPLAGALSQEAIDVAVILNALRAAFGGKGK